MQFANGPAIFRFRSLDRQLVQSMVQCVALSTTTNCVVLFEGLILYVLQDGPQGNFANGPTFYRFRLIERRGINCVGQLMVQCVPCPTQIIV